MKARVREVVVVVMAADRVVHKVTRRAVLEDHSVVANKGPQLQEDEKDIIPIVDNLIVLEKFYQLIIIIHLHHFTSHHRLLRQDKAGSQLTRI